MTIFYSPNVLNSFEINHLVLLVLPPFENWIVQGNAESSHLIDFILIQKANFISPY